MLEGRSRLSFERTKAFGNMKKLTRFSLFRKKGKIHKSATNFKNSDKNKETNSPDIDSKCRQ